MAQVFDERGDGVIIRGDVAKWSKEDRQVHLSQYGAFSLLSQALLVYRREHKHFPARVVVHKTSLHNAAELDGFKEALRQQSVDLFDFISLRRSFT